MFKQKKHILLIISPILLFLACHPKTSKVRGNNYLNFVNPLIGSGGHGHVFVGASVPHGMVQLGPNNLTKGWDWCSGYHDSDSTIIGFAQTHLSGTGIADLGDIIFMPVGKLPSRPMKDTASFAKTYFSTFDKSTEIAKPHYYQVKLKRYQIEAELTASQRVGLQRYHFPKNSEANVIVNLEESVQSILSRKGTLDAGIKILNDTTISGYRISDEWAKDHKIYFTTVFSKPILKHQILSGADTVYAKEANGIRLNTILNFENDNQPLLLKTGISYVSEAGAALNLKTEMPGWDFEQTKAKAEEAWNKSLSKFDFEAQDSTIVTQFYTALYHSQIAPSVFSDVNGDYRGADGKIYQAKGFTPYTIFSLWDTYRAVHPLYTLTDERVADYANSLLAIQEQQGTMPVWHLVGNETGTMVGFHSIPVVVDAYLKGFNLSQERVWNAIKGFEDYNQLGLKDTREQGYISADQESWSVAKGLEYAIDSYAIAKFAAQTGKKEAFKTYFKSSQNYKNYFDKSTGFMRGKLSDGSWRANFNPYHSIHMEDDYVEGNAWQYTWLVPHDVEGLINVFGGENKFTTKLDSLFTVKSDLNEGASIDITGMIGQYAHGNEPSHHILYLYPFVGQQWKTAEKVCEVFDKFYKATPNGLIGNEDCGQMSAWYIFSSMGFYPVNPVNGMFVFGSPLADKINITLNNGKKFKIIALHNSATHKYIQSVKLNGKAYTKSYIMYDDIMNGGTLEYTMGSKPNKAFGLTKTDRPVSNP
ncbi:GH92 family glycosyl hydrolase [Pedobacter glucosidilyticus]|uniref:GH92 family glycosyl hydrolase n=1 Tax=Pedobacter glucosidilyticus TaxID=1122941 RepID=UPI0004180D34|nr:GH92 family glycosyl hydrolase [Pedobacter glucosidilyticus]